MRVGDAGADIEPTRSQWRAKARFFHDEDIRYLRFLIPEDASVLELGSGAGHLLSALKPARGVGIERDERRVAESRSLYPRLECHFGDVEDPAVLEAVEGKFDFVLLADTLGQLTDCQALLERLHRFCHAETRLILVYYSYGWEPLLKLAEAIGWKERESPRNVLSPADVQALADLAGFEPIKSERRLLSPLRLLGFGRLVNRFLSPLPILRQLAFRHYVVCRSPARSADAPKSATIVIPARNERGNIEAAINRMPRFCDDIEILFVEGHSRDGTLEEIYRVQASHPEWDIRVLEQAGKGKADAVFAAFDVARGEVLMILDSDLSMPPEQLPKFWHAIHSGHGEFINGTRLVYPMENEAMRFLNFVANRIFSILFSWMLNQRYTDTLCGTKVLRRADYEKIRRNRTAFGVRDPFGDFDLIFGASKLNLKTVEIPVRYAARTYGTTQISRFRHGALLLKMLGFAYLKLKAI